ncbi:MAG: radical SAM protein, partial [Kiritimatiellae bacterium]|nr:radical SAM protein [Kiritimatiellia bacterium]
ALGEADEFTVELNPRDVAPDLLAGLRAGGVNRISMGVQSLDDGVLRAMGRPHTAAEAEAAFRAIREAGFANAGLDLIAGWPGTTADSWGQTLGRACALRPDHVSVYTLIREPGTSLDRAVMEGRVALPDDDAALAQHDAARAALAAIGLARYEVSSFAKPGFECRHNVSVWHGDDYAGIGDGAHGREGLRRTAGNADGGYDVTELSPEADALERALFALRTVEGIDLDETARRWPVLAPRRAAWRAELMLLVPHGIARETAPDRFALTDRGFEVCDAVISAIMSAGQETDT